jgi:hypothetical protein
MKNKTMTLAEVKVIEKRISSKCEFLIDKRNTLLENLKENVSYQFAWIGEDLYMTSYKADHYQWIYKMGSLEGNTIMEMLEYKIEELKSYVKHSYNVRQNSTGTLHREVSTWQYIASMELINELENL